MSGHWSSEHLSCPQIVDVDDAFESAVMIHDRKRRDLAGLHQAQGAGGKLSGPDRQRGARHAIGSGQAEGTVSFPLKKPPEVSVRDEADQPVPFLNHGG